MMALGLFVFELTSAPPQSVGRETAQNWQSKSRPGQAPAHQYLGRGEETRALSGVLYPLVTGGGATLDRLRAMADTGQAWILIDGAGRSHGRWFISGISETRSELLRSGAARKIDFTINLTRYWGSDPARFGDILESLP